MVNKTKKLEYLSEAEYQKINKKIKIAGVIVIILGFCLLCAGIFISASASQMEVPNRNDPNWFEASLAQQELRGSGNNMIASSVFIMITGCSIRFRTANQRKIKAYQAQEKMPIAQESITKMAPTMGTAAREIVSGIKEEFSDQETLFCKYCGTRIDADSVFCKHCGKPQS